MNKQLIVLLLGAAMASAQTPTIIVVPPQPPFPVVVDPLKGLVDRMIQIQELKLQQQAIQNQRDSIQMQRQSQSAPAAAPQPPIDISNTKTLGMLNGRAWRNFSRFTGAKSVFIAGILAGWELERSTLATTAKLDFDTLPPDEMATQAKVEDLSQMLDDVYSLTENLDVPIAITLYLAINVQRGSIAVDLLTEMATARLSVTKALEASPRQ